MIKDDIDDILIMKNIIKKYPGVIALKNVNFSCKEAEVHALVGENGAGKSTLVKILSGTSLPTSGEIYFKGKKFEAHTAQESHNAGISIIFQEFNLIPEMNATENIFLGREITQMGIIKYSLMYQEAKKIFESLGIDIPLTVPIKKLGIAQKQAVEIAKALSIKASLLIMDEPTAPLMSAEIKCLFNMIRILKSKGVTIVYISHRLEEIFKIADRVTVLKDGEYVGTRNIESVGIATLIKMMVGRTIKNIYPKKVRKTGEKILEVKNLNKKRVINKISFSLYKGEVLGIAGLVGSGRTELVSAIFGADKADSGVICIEGKNLRINEPVDAIKNGIGFVPEDRKTQGLFLSLSVRNNITITILKMLVRHNFIRGEREKKLVSYFIDQLKISTPSLEAKVVNLSGGNQQKVVLAKWLAKKCKILILDEPTRGVDVGVKFEFYNLIRKMASEGLAIIMISSELEEVIGLADRIIVMREGKIVHKFSCDEEITKEKILNYAMKGDII